MWRKNMNNEPLVTIITPLYNYGKFLGDTVNSVLSQNYKNWEMIIIDDCSTDDSFEIAKQYAERDPRIKAVQLEKNGGTAAARNKGLYLARGEYIAFLDSDDQYDSNYLEEQLKCIQDNNAEVVVASYRRKAPNSTTDFIVPKDITFDMLPKGNPMAPLGTFYKFEPYKSLRFLTDMTKCEDLVFFLELLKDGTHAVGNQKVLGTLRIHENSKSRKKYQLIKWQLKAYKKVGIPFFKRWYCLACWAINGVKKYKNVK